jgi:hypothetical protein
MQRLGDCGELVAIARQEEGKLFRFVGVGAIVGDDAGPKCMRTGEDAVVPDHVEPGRRNQSTQTSEESVGSA